MTNWSTWETQLEYLVDNVYVSAHAYCIVCTLNTQAKYFFTISRLTVVSREANKGQSDCQKTKRVTNYCVSFTRANVFVIWRHNHSQYLSIRVNFFKPALKTQNLLANINQHPKDKSTWLLK